MIVRPARDEEARACRMLVPRMFGVADAPELLVAVGAGGLAGALSFGKALLADGRGVPFTLEVVAPSRRRGVGRALIEAAAAACGAPGLRAYDPVEPGSPAMAFLRACGFEGQDLVQFFEADLAAFHAQVAGLRARLEARGRVPAGCRVLTLREAPGVGVARLVAAHFPATAGRVLQRLRADDPLAFDLDRSTALVVDGAVLGALILDWHGALPSIEVRVVDPALRGGWANTLLLERSCALGLAAGARRFRFFADSEIADTMKLAQRAGAERLRTETYPHRAL